MRAALAFLLLAFTCYGQGFGKTAAFKAAAAVQGTPVAAVASNWCPTNEPYGSGTNLVSWYLGTDYYTNGVVATWPDRGGVNAWNLTNASGTVTKRPSASGSGVQFSASASTYLTCANYTNPADHTVVMVMTNRLAPGDTAYFIDGKSSANRHQWYQYNGTFTALSPSGLDFANVITNTWFAIEIYFSGTGYVYTNGVQAASGNVGNGTCSGLTLGAKYDLSTSPASMIVNEVVTYRGALSAASRSNLYYYFKNIKGYPLP